VAIARLLLKAPAVVVLDEATAHLDSESEAAVQLALRTALAGRTSLVIAHRLSTIREADQILVIDDGQVRERGGHDELLAAGGLYADLYRTQFSRQAVGPGVEQGPPSGPPSGPPNGPNGHHPPHPPRGDHPRPAAPNGARREPSLPGQLSGV
jgi:ATP-binding cassette subfamily B protein